MSGGESVDRLRQAAARLSWRHWTEHNGSGPRWRWAIAYRLDRLTGQCWSDLVTWVLAWEPEQERLRDVWKPQGAVCRSDAARTGSCYCGKVQDPDGLARWLARDLPGAPL